MTTCIIKLQYSSTSCSDKIFPNMKIFWDIWFGSQRQQIKAGYSPKRDTKSNLYGCHCDNCHVPETVTVIRTCGWLVVLEKTRMYTNNFASFRLFRSYKLWRPQIAQRAQNAFMSGWKSLCLPQFTFSFGPLEDTILFWAVENVIIFAQRIVSASILRKLHTQSLSRFTELLDFSKARCLLGRWASYQLQRRQVLIFRCACDDWLEVRWYGYRSAAAGVARVECVTTERCINSRCSEHKSL